MIVSLLFFHLAENKMIASLLRPSYSVFLLVACFFSVLKCKGDDRFLNIPVSVFLC